MRTKALMMTTTLALLGVARASAQPATDLFPVEPGVNTERGFAVALDGDLLAVGAPLDDENGRDAGAVYVFRWESSSWEQEAKLTGDDVPGAGPALRFGSAVALRGGILAVGALGEGAVYVFEETEFGWIRQAKLTDPAGNGAGTFGRAVAVDGGRLAVAAVNPHGRAAGAVYLYAGAPWTAPPQRFRSAQARERFGQALSLAGDLLVVGAPGHSRGAESYAGAAHVFRLGGGAPVKIARLTADDGRDGDQLGAAVATDGTTVVLGAPTADGERSNSGAAYVSTCEAATCTAPDRLTGAEPAADAMLGFSVAVDEDLLVAGAHGFARPGEPGGLRVFRGAGASWTEEAVPAVPRPGNAEERDLVGFAVALDGSRAVAAAVLGDQGGAAAGAVWSFMFDPEEGWREEAEAVARDPLLRPVDLAATARFGVSVAATEEYLVVGALREPGDPSAGAVYVYRRAGLGWRQEARLTSPVGEDAPDGFGTSVATDGTLLLVAAPFGVTSDLISGSVTIPPRAYLFSRSSRGWRPEVDFNPDSPSPGEVFGASLAVEGDVVVIGAPSPVARGGVYIAEREAGVWFHKAFLAAAVPEPGDGFGTAVALRQGVLAIGAPGTPGEIVVFSRKGEPAVVAPAPGAVYVARRQQGVWSASLRLPSPPLSTADRLGASVALGDGVLAIGAPGREDGEGSVLVYGESGPSWGLEQEVVGSTSAREFGAAVALLDDRLAVGAPGESGEDDEPGRAYLFERGDGWELVIDEGALRPTDGDQFGTAIALTDDFLTVTQPGSPAGDRVTVFTLRQDEAAEEK